MAGLPRLIELDEALLVHGFFEPGVVLAEQQEKCLVGVLGADMRLKRELDRPWYELYDGSKPLVVGHHDYLRDGQPLVVRGAGGQPVYGLDTGCCLGGRLTGLLLPGFEILSVPSKRNYWSIVLDGLPKPEIRDPHLERLKEAPLVELTWSELEALGELVEERDEELPADATIRDRARQGLALMARGEDVLGPLRNRLLEENQSHLAALRASSGYDSLPPREQYEQYLARVADDPLTRSLLSARVGRLNVEKLRRHLRTPTAAIAAARSLEP